MKKLLTLILLIISLNAFSQSVFFKVDTCELSNKYLGHENFAKIKIDKVVIISDKGVDIHSDFDPVETYFKIDIVDGEIYLDSSFSRMKFSALDLDLNICHYTAGVANENWYLIIEYPDFKIKYYLKEIEIFKNN
jgi:hypothetical protein